MERQQGKQKYQVKEQERTIEKMQDVPKGNICPHCGAVNETEALFCENCGEALKESNLCPNCHFPLDKEADYCEHCKTYICEHRCSFCGAEIAENDVYCPECGAPRKGIICPVCHTRSSFSYCPVCAIPLTEEALRLSRQAHQAPVWKQMNSLATELENLMNVIPVETPRQLDKRKENEELCQRVRRLLNENYTSEDIHTQSKSVTSLQNEIASKRKELQRLLELVETQAQENPVLARNYIMAHKPATTLLGWKCNFKHVVHSSPCGCSCPQMGGKWIVLNSDTKVEDDFNLNSAE